MASCHAHLFEWFKRFSKGCQNVKDNKCPRQPSTSKTKENVDKICSTRSPTQCLNGSWNHEHWQKHTIDKIFSTGLPIQCPNGSWNHEHWHRHTIDKILHEGITLWTKFVRWCSLGFSYQSKENATRKLFYHSPGTWWLLERWETFQKIIICNKT